MPRFVLLDALRRRVLPAPYFGIVEVRVEYVASLKFSDLHMSTAILHVQSGVANGL